MRRLMYLGFAALFTLTLFVEPVQARRKTTKKVVEPTLEEGLSNEIWVVLEKGTRSADMVTRATAIENLSRINAEKARDYVVDAVADPQWVVRYSAIKTLIGLNNDAYRKPLANAIANSALYEKKERSPLNLVLLLPHDEAVELLKEALIKVESVRDIILKEIFRPESPIAAQFYESLKNVPAVKGWVLDNLAVFKDKNLYPLLVKSIATLTKEELLKVFAFLEGLDKSYDVSFLSAYLKDKDEQLQEGAAFILVSRGDERGLEIMLPLCDENDVRRQLRCINSIKGLPTNPEVKERAKLFLYGDPDPQVLYAVYELFTNAQDESIYERMVARLQSTTNIGHRAAAVYFIPKLKGTRALPQLHGMLRDGSPLIRQKVAQAIGELRQAESVPFLEDALNHDNNDDVRRELVKALGSIGDRSIIRVVSFLIFDPTVKDAAIDALCNVQHRDAIPTLRNVLQTQFNANQRARALEAIIRISPAEGVDVFKAALGWIPSGFLERMAKQLKREFIEYLKMALTSINPEVRKEAVLAFRYMGSDVELKVLQTQLFSATDTDLRVTILHRISEIQGKDSLPMLQAFLKDKNRELRLAAIQETAKYAEKNSEASAALRGLLVDPDDVFRVAAAAALLDIHLRPVS